VSRSPNRASRVLIVLAALALAACGSSSQKKTPAAGGQAGIRGPSETPKSPATPITPTGTTGTTRAAADSSVVAIQSCLKRAGFTVETVSYSDERATFRAGGITVHDFYTAARATSFANSPGGHYDTFGTYAVGPGHSSDPTQARVETCVRSGLSGGL
jgi:hypothetical protein